MWWIQWVRTLWNSILFTTHFYFKIQVKNLLDDVKVKWSRYRPGVAQRVGRGIAIFFHDRGNRSGWVVSSTPRPHFTPGKDPIPILQEAGWAPGPLRMGGKSRPRRDSTPDRPAHSQSLYRLSYPAHIRRCRFWNIFKNSYQYISKSILKFYTSLLVYILRVKIKPF